MNLLQKNASLGLQDTHLSPKIDPPLKAYKGAQCAPYSQYHYPVCGNSPVGAEPTVASAAMSSIDSTC
jgi:hypothetical protein